MSTETMIVLAVIFILFVGGAYYRQLQETADRKRKYRAQIQKRIIIIGTGTALAVTGLLAGRFLDSIEVSVRQTLEVVSWFLLALFLAEGIHTTRLIRKEKRNDGREAGEEEQGGPEAETVTEPEEWIKEEKPSYRELFILAAVTFVYGLFIFWRLGSMEAPKTFMEIVPDTEGSHEIVLDLGEEREVDSLYLYLGHMLDRVLAVSYYDSEKEEWIVLEEEVEAKENYKWNRIEVDEEIKYLGIVSRSGRAVFHEMVLLDAEGNKILPVNKEEYPLLFDEQEQFPEDVTYYTGTMFDEVYYAGSAYEFLNGEEMFEETHPPLGKILISIGEVLFGVCPFGWRFVCAVCGILMLPLMYWFLYRIFKNAKIALLGTVLLSLDFMHFTLSRIATLDSIIAFFILAMFAVMWRILERAGEERKAGRRNPSPGLVVTMVVCAVINGMAVATKWTGFYAMAGIAFFFLAFLIKETIQAKKEGGTCHYMGVMLGEGILIFGVLPLGIYVLAFLPEALATGQSNVWKVMWENSLFMLNFHSDIVFEHPYRSDWYTWGWDKMPLIDAADNLRNGKTSLVVTMGNPVLWWGGLISVFHMLYRSLFKKDKKAAYLVLSYLFMLAPWFFVRRTVFIYQYYASSLFMLGMLGYSLYLLGRKYKKAVPAAIEVALFIFILFFPIISGIPVGTYHVQIYLEWLRSWEFVII